MLAAQERLSREVQDMAIEDATAALVTVEVDNRGSEFLAPLEDGRVQEDRIVSQEVPPGLNDPGQTTEVTEEVMTTEVSERRGQVTEVSRTERSEERSIEDRQREGTRAPNGPHSSTQDLRTPPPANQGSDMVQGGFIASGQDAGRTSEGRTPLFNDNQLRQFEALQQQASWLYRPMELANRPAWFEQEMMMRRLEEEAKVKEMRTMTERLQELENENAALKMHAGFRTPSRFSTPDDQRGHTKPKESSPQAARPPQEAEVAPQEAETTTAAQVQENVRRTLNSLEGWKRQTEGTEVPPTTTQDPVRSEGRQREAEVPPRSEESKAKEGSSQGQGQEKTKGEGTDDLRAVLQGMVRLMEGMQLMQSQILDVKKAKEMEVVKSSVSELPKLADWKSDSAPLDLTDWFLTIEPAMGDLSDGSQQWWDGMLRAAKNWYAQHQEKTPLERVCHKPEVPPELRELRYQRLEKRATALLMSAIPGSQQEEVIAGKDVSTMNILAKLMLSYQPGGLSEKSAILTALDSPDEAQNLSQAVTGLRKWLRWHRRAGEVGVVRPDATIQVKGLGRLMKKVLKDNADLAFRIQLAKSSLQIDTTPTETSVMTYANHLLAEVEQIAHQDRKRREEKPVSPDPKLKRIGEETMKGEGKGGRQDRQVPCKFFCSEEGCKKGKACSWSHVLDDKKRCWNCGSTQHFSPACERPRDPAKEGDREKSKGEGKGQKGIGRMSKKEEVKEESQGKEESESPSHAESVKELLEEANKMLKSLTVKTQGEEEKTKVDRLEAMQVQLDEMRKLKVLRLSRIAKQEMKYGLLDSGATHPMRGRKEGEDLKKLEEVQVSLANGAQVAMRMTQKGVMVLDESDVEPIAPMSHIIERLGYTMSWSGRQMKLTHPWKQDIKVVMINGCPQVPQGVALHLIDELEKGDRLRKMEVSDKDRSWIHDLTQLHPALKTLPEEVKKSLVVQPGEDLKGLPNCSRRRRRIMEREGFVVHLYAGEKDGYTLERALKECGGDKRRLVEIDILRQDSSTKSHDMLAESGPYPSLLRAALNGWLKGIVMGPNCRTRSVLRHYPLPIPGGGPRPLRSWEEPWGMKRNTKEEQTKVVEDDILMWRGMMLYIIGEELRRGYGHPEEEKIHLGLEQPADPTEYMPETVTFWKTKEWEQMKLRYQLHEQTFLQSRWGGLAKKPTTFAGTIRLSLPDSQEDEDQVREKDEERKVKSSKDLARWAPGMMRQVAERLQEVVFGKKVWKIRKATWEEHVRRGHCPFRRDCQVCQEASARGRMHRKIVHPKAGVLNVDVAGPFHQGNDLEKSAKFMLIGTYTWLRSEERQEDEEEEVWEDPGRGDLEEEGEEGPEIEEDLGIEDQEAGEVVEAEGREEEPREVEREVEEPAVEDRRDPKIEVIRVGIPLTGKSKEVVLEGVAELYLQLRSGGFPVHTVHTDRGREFSNHRMKSWLRCRGIQHTMNGGQDPQANGRAERAVGEVKKMVRRLLHASGMASMWWPMALRYLMETARLRRKDEDKAIPCFGQKVLVKKRIWRQKALEPTHESTIYLTPVLEYHGHCVLRQDGNWGVAPYVLKNVQNPPPPTDEMWLALAEEAERDEVQERRRIRGKQAIRDGDLRKLMRVRQMLQEESLSIDLDTIENAVMSFKKIDFSF